MPAGKVCTGFSKPYVAYYHASGGLITYTGARKLARGVSVNIAPNTSDDNKFYADNVEAESASGIFTGGTLTVTVDGLFADAEKMIMGLPAAGADGFMAYGDSQQAPDMGFGCIARYMSGGVTTYTPTVLAKVKFSQPAIDAKTQEDSIDWQTQELTAAIMRGEDANRNWKYVGSDYPTEEEAEAALKKKLGIISYAVVQTLSDITSSFMDALIDEGAALTAVLTPAEGAVIDTVTVTMGGVDITSTAWDSATHTVSIEAVTGTVNITAAANVFYTIAQNLTPVGEITSTLTENTIEHGEALEATITGGSGRVIKTITVTMGGTDITATAWDSGTGKVSIASVTGNVVIAAHAAYPTAALTLTDDVDGGGAAFIVNYKDEENEDQFVRVAGSETPQTVNVYVGSTVWLEGTPSGVSAEWKLKLGSSSPVDLGTGETLRLTMPNTASGMTLSHTGSTDVFTIVDPTGGMSGYTSSDFTVV